MNTTPAYVPNHLVWAILTTLFCCLPLGIVSIVHAAQVNGKTGRWRRIGCAGSFEKAKKWAIWSAVGWVIAVILYVIFFVVVGGMSAMQQ